MHIFSWLPIFYATSILTKNVGCKRCELVGEQMEFFQRCTAAKALWELLQLIMTDVENRKLQTTNEKEVLRQFVMTETAGFLSNLIPWIIHVALSTDLPVKAWFCFPCNGVYSSLFHAKASGGHSKTRETRDAQFLRKFTRFALIAVTSARPRACKCPPPQIPVSQSPF